MPGPFGKVAAPPPHFPVGGPVPAADLVGRETYIRRAVERLADGNHLLVAGPRRIGKTSIILEVLRRLRRKGALTAYVDCLGPTDMRGLGERLADAVLENGSGVERTLEQAKAVAAGMRPTLRVRYEHVEMALQLAREKNAQRFFESALDLPRTLAAQTGKRVVVVCDEFQAAGRLGPRVFDTMRTHFQSQRGVAYAFLGSEEGILEELFSEKGRAFYRFAVPLDLTDAGGQRFGIAPDDWLDYIRGKFAERKIAIDDSLVDRLLDATGGHPQDTMQLCAALYYLARGAGQQRGPARDQHTVDPGRRAGGVVWPAKVGDRRVRVWQVPAPFILDTTLPPARGGSPSDPRSLGHVLNQVSVVRACRVSGAGCNSSRRARGRG